MLWTIYLLFFAIGAVEGFLPVAQIGVRPATSVISTTATTTSLSSSFPSSVEPLAIVSSNAAASSSALISDAGSTALTVGVFLLGAVLAYFLASRIMVESMIDDIQKTYPQFYQSYVDRLEPGQELKMRPDLVQEMIQKVANRVVEQFEETDTLAKEVESKHPYDFKEIKAKLGLGETFAMREDLIKELKNVLKTDSEPAAGIASLADNQWADEPKRDEIK